MDELVKHINAVAVNMFDVAKKIQTEKQQLIAHLNMVDDEYEKTLSILHEMVEPEVRENVISPALAVLRTFTYVDLRESKLYIEDTKVVNEIQ